MAERELVLQSRPLSSYESREIEWLWQNRIPLGCVTLIEGDGGVGKSSIIAAIGSAISSGRALPEDATKSPKGVLLLAAEDDPSVVLRPRFESNGANLNLVRCYDQAMLLNKEGMEALDREITEHEIGLVVIDPVVSFLGQAVDMSSATDVRSFMSPLHEMARKHSCAIVVVRHWNKSSTASASQRGSGSVDFRNAARSVLQVIKGDDLNYLTLEKSNYGATGKTLTFNIVDKLVQWSGTSDLSADDILKERQQNNTESKSEISEAINFIEEELKDGPIKSSDLQASAKQCGISEATLRRARQKLKVVAIKMTGNIFYAYLPHQVPNATPHHAHDVHESQSRFDEHHEHHELHLGQMEIGEFL